MTPLAAATEPTELANMVRYAMLHRPRADVTVPVWILVGSSADEVNYARRFMTSRPVMATA